MAHELTGDQWLWFGASLRPWQILHSRLARIHTCSLLERDVWELMDETVEAATPDQIRFQSKQEEVQLVMLVGDDGELWRHGGLMEARIRDWLTCKVEEEARHSEVAPARFNSQFSEANVGLYSSIGYGGDPDQYEDRDHSCYYNDSSVHNTIAIQSSDQFNGLVDNTLEGRLDQAAGYGQAALRAVGYGGQQLGGEVFYDHAEEYHGEDEVGNGAETMATLEETLQYTADTRHSCQFSDDMAHEVSAYQVGDQLEDEQELCAVCLEELIDVGDHGDDQEWLQALTVDCITRLPCRHSFHSRCLGTWLIRGSSRCPCCRAWVTLSYSRKEEAAPYLGTAVSSGGGSSSSDTVERDVMGIVAELEAALDRFGLLS